MCKFQVFSIQKTPLFGNITINTRCKCLKSSAFTHSKTIKVNREFRYRIQASSFSINTFNRIHFEYVWKSDFTLYSAGFYSTIEIRNGLGLMEAYSKGGMKNWQKKSHKDISTSTHMPVFKCGSVFSDVTNIWTSD